ncbi:hypothetical protein [Methanobacterium sp. BAmetb5]|jgi:hypothetical protein|uniref:hypothetical protein n=1 Tax=Methanobacterium sp. BAmetb5 TaxID=2025351 RepID=UPI000E83E514|nr:hypothetical protein [Methanobacterium sp. BAmetb5]AXV39364.1 MAG: hypothetical protein CIT02_03075 [Methanobacterium sp. BAmetb5]
MNISKKMLGLLVLVCMVVVISGCTTNTSNNTGNSNASVNNSTNATASNDVSVVVSYPGSWAADVSGTFGYRSLSGTGDQTTNLGSVSGSVTISARKTEGGSGTLTTSIMKGGKNLGTASTSAPWGGASTTAII